MVESYPSKIEYPLSLSGIYTNELDIEAFSHMMKDPSYCYKFYWLEAIVKLISSGIEQTTFNDIIDEMITNAWYSVLEFHIHLSGVFGGEIKDGLERAVLLLCDLSNLSGNASEVEIKNAIKDHELELKAYKEQLTNMVPYRALAGFFDKHEERADWSSAKRMIAYIEKVNHTILLPYTLGPSPKLKKEVYFNEAWIRMIQDNTVSILGWIQYEKVKWLQNNNPEVPGIIYKIAPINDKMRKLKKVHDLWDIVIETQPIVDVFTGKMITAKSYEVDHFIPWSFVMNDELWNLMPMDSGLNSSKSNKLPKWSYFEKFAKNQFTLYTAIYDERNPEIFKKYQACFRDNLHSIWANQELYRPGNEEGAFCRILEKNMRPVYDSAKRQGYEVWKI